ncbi:GNAT family N-acetyltransferase [Bradyrhizobium sp.]|uniref:GNAT family N-acetyltransferase n=1 Tax=Bradyrhizobium sp. TaxID=376 RepID=UPI002386E3D1|nr:GNAT family N-acetyltransferase [Bradyrhizobium sp.]MDE2380204.1 GNAT family N-acetyltransferase [Bradyrhizobium sp.]
MTDIRTFIVHPGTPELAICARWRAEAFAVLDAGFEQELRALESFAADQTHQVALIAKRGGEPVGTCLLVPSEIEPLHQVSPWLAGLYVAPEHRRCGAGAALVRAIEQQARLRGFGRLFLYTISAAGFYQRLGWNVEERVSWKGFDTVFMSRALAPLTTTAAAG